MLWGMRMKQKQKPQGITRDTSEATCDDSHFPFFLNSFPYCWTFLTLQKFLWRLSTLKSFWFCPFLGKLSTSHVCLWIQNPFHHQGDRHLLTGSQACLVTWVRQPRLVPHLQSDNDVTYKLGYFRPSTRCSLCFLPGLL